MLSKGKLWVKCHLKRLLLLCNVNMPMPTDDSMISYNNCKNNFLTAIVKYKLVCKTIIKVMINCPINILMLPLKVSYQSIQTFLNIYSCKHGVQKINHIHEILVIQNKETFTNSILIYYLSNIIFYYSEINM